MRAVSILLLVACFMAVSVFAQDADSTPAIMTPPPSNLVAPRIYAPAPPAGSPDADAPLTGAVPANLKPSAVSENIYGGVVEFATGTTDGGCPCKKQLPEKYRYDTQFKNPAPAAPAPCGCATPAPANPADSLPPIIAALKPEPKPAAAPCANPNVPAKPVAKIVPQYKDSVAPVAPPAPCAAPAPAKPATVVPEFYPVQPLTAAQIAAKKAARIASRKAAAGKKAAPKKRKL